MGSSIAQTTSTQGVGGSTPVAPPASGGAPLATSSAVPSSVGGSAQPASATAPAGNGLPGLVAAKRVVAKPTPPTPGQVKALELLQHEARVYSEGARSYQKSLTMIVRHHYEERRRRILAALDREITSEKKGLTEAREEAIRRLEAFVLRYSGENADPTATPDAMFRLAALYEERARTDFEGDIGPQLEPAIQLYRRIVRDYPKYEETAAVHYYLGHALTDAGRLEEGQQAWRSLVCHNRYQVKDNPNNPQAILLQPLEQDHDNRFWDIWYTKNPIPVDQMAGRRGGANTPKSLDPAEELSFRDPYGDCQPIAQQVTAGEEPRYLAEIWWQLGNFHFDQIDPAGGPYNLNRSVSAYDQGMQYKKPPLYGVTLYKQAWAYFKQQRYRTATEAFVRLLGYADEQEAKTGDPGADFRAEAYTYIAGSLTYVDFDGPGKLDPYVPRNDVLDIESDPVVAEQKMSIAIQRVQDPSLIPQDKKWSVEIYKALAQEYSDISQNRNAIATMELMLQRFPLDRDAPLVQHKVAELYDQIARLAPEGSAARAEYSGKALAARGRLAAYVGATPWTDANRDDPEALQQAELLVRGGLKRAAADHTNFARAYYDRALELNDAKEQSELILKSVAEYRLADQGWSAYLEQDPTALDSYETRFWVADARYWVAVLQVVMGRTPSPDEVRMAREAAVAVRDSNEDDKYLQPAAYYVVTLAEKILEDNYRIYRDSDGAQGIEQRQAVEFEGEGDARKVRVTEIPGPVRDAMQARDEYNARISPDRDPQKNGMLYAFQAADYAFVYGQFTEARQRFQPIFEENCGKNEWGYKAWEKLISMSNFEGKVDESRRLAEGKSCAYNEETKRAEDAIRKPVKQGVAYLDARKLYDEAEKMAPGPERDKRWREAAAAYKVALDAAPDRDEAPEAAMNGAFAYKQVGEYDKAIEMYELFIGRYGSESTLKKLKDGDPKAKPPVEANPKKYGERVTYLKNAYDALAAAYVLFFDYPRAAETFEKISSTSHFPEADRRESAKQALVLYTSLGDRGGMNRTRDKYRQLGASQRELAEADFVVATADLKRWDEFSPDEGANQEARKRAQKAMSDYYDAEKNREASTQFVVQAAYHVAKMKKASGAFDTNDWWKNTINAFQRYKARAPVKDGRNSALGSREATMAAEADYTLLDQELGKKFDYETGHHRYKGTTVEVIGQYRKDASEAKQWFDKLQAISEAYLSPEYTPITIARQGSLYDSLRTGLYNTRPPALKMLDKKLEDLLRRAEESGIPELQEQADAKRIAIQEAWRKARDQELDSADRILVDRYATAVVLARRYNVSNPAITRAIRRLAFVTDVAGEAKMSGYASAIKDLNYTPGMFQRMRPGLVTTPKPEGMPQPLPVLPQ
jgi:outer membrane protein assembly factor BamD (BamD/ComL family)